MNVRTGILLCIPCTLVLQIIKCRRIKHTYNIHYLQLDSSMKSSKPFLAESTLNDYICTSRLIPSSSVDARNKHSSFSESGDSTTQSDIVRNQYESLPYPKVTKERIELLRKHYDDKDKRNDPFARVLGSDLETINYYLFKGRNNFRYVIKPYPKMRC